MTNKLILVRGLPGSGKSTFAKSIGCLHLEADMFFMRDGVYTFIPNLVKRAHTWCKTTASNALFDGMDVVVSNTFTRLWEMEDYFDMHDDIEVYKCTGEYGSIHDVPFSTLHEMRTRWEDYDGEIVIQ